MLKRYGAGLLTALLLTGMLAGCRSARKPESSATPVGELSDPTTITDNWTEDENSMTTTETADSAVVTDSTARQTGSKTTTGTSASGFAQTTTAQTTAAGKKGYLSKSDTTVEPVRSLKEIMATLTNGDLTCNAYDPDKYLIPYWKGNIVYNESLTFVTDPATGKASAPLLFDAARILSVKDSSLKTTYREGVDYVYEDGRLVLTEGSSIFCFDYSDLYFTAEKKGACFPLKKGGYSLFQEGTYFHTKQVAVTYVHSEPWTGYKPAYQGSMLPKVISKLKNGEDVSIVYLGDSIVKGGNASGMFGAAPNMPIWTDMVTAALKKAYPTANITAYSASENGATTAQALKNLRTLCSNQKPDLVIIGFGMNDGSDANIPPERFQSNIQSIMETNDLLTGKSCDYLLLSTTLPNPEIVLGDASNQDKLAAKLFELEKAGTATTGGVVVGDITAVHQYLLQSKRFIDMTANNVNHPNDFLVRAYAQLVCTMLIQ